MKVTIVRAADLVYLDGRAFAVDCSALPEAVAVVQWDGVAGVGHVEYDNSDPAQGFAPNSSIVSLGAYADIFNAALAAREAIDNPPDPPPPDQAQLLAYSAAKRWEKETGGIIVSGVPVATDERTQGVLTAAFVLASADPGYTIPDWKVGPGVYVSLTAAQIVAIANAVRAHVQACFTLNRTVDEAIAAEEVTTFSGVDAAYS